MSFFIEEQASISWEATPGSRGLMELLCWYATDARPEDGSPARVALARMLVATAESGPVNGWRVHRTHDLLRLLPPSTQGRDHVLPVVPALCTFACLELAHLSGGRASAMSH